MMKTHLFRDGDGQAALIPAELAYDDWDMTLVIERHGDELRIRPAPPKGADAERVRTRLSLAWMTGDGHTDVAGETEPVG